MSTKLLPPLGLAWLFIFCPLAVAKHNSAESVAARIAPVGQLNIRSADLTGTASAPADATAATTADNTASTAALDGEAVYNTSCMTCHASGVGGAPLLGDASAWAERLQQGLEVLVEHAINGFQGSLGVMPPKGGNLTLSDAEVRAAVEFMLPAAE